MENANRQVSLLKNIGPTLASDLNAAGIFTHADLVALGAKQAFLKLLAARQQSGRSVACCNASYLYALYGAIADINWQALPEHKKTEFKRYTQSLRESGHFNS